MLRVSLLGNLGADPELRYTQKGAPIATFRVAVKQVRTGPDGERQENTEWFRVRALGRLAEMAQPLTKGTRVLVVGRLDIGHYQSRQGDMRTGFDVWADQVVNLSSTRPSSTSEAEAALEVGTDAEPETVVALEPVGVGRSARAATNGARSRAPASPGPLAEGLDDLPF